MTAPRHIVRVAPSDPPGLWWSVCAVCSQTEVTANRETALDRAHAHAATHLAEPTA